MLLVAAVLLGVVFVVFVWSVMATVNRSDPRRLATRARRKMDRSDRLNRRAGRPWCEARTELTVTAAGDIGPAVGGEAFTAPVHCTLRAHHDGSHEARDPDGYLVWWW